MTVNATIQGRIAEPELKYTQGGKAVLDLRICATPRKKNRDTGEWADDGTELWVSSPFWGDEAERLAEVLTRGDLITVFGSVAQEEFTRRDGGQGQKLVVRFPKFLGLVPRAPQASQDRFSAPQTQNVASYQSGAYNAPQTPQNDPAGNLAQSGLWGGSDQRAPF